MAAARFMLQDLVGASDDEGIQRQCVWKALFIATSWKLSGNRPAFCWGGCWRNPIPFQVREPLIFKCHFFFEANGTWFETLRLSLPLTDLMSLGFPSDYSILLPLFNRSLTYKIFFQFLLFRLYTKCVMRLRLQYTEYAMFSGHQGGYQLLWKHECLFYHSSFGCMI